ncbi:unnamed protein product [Rotaria sp. Silwood2]|nr:unnamed protein product [Rotaria sp. Silwood2]CAF3992309.1 unnamed protein product [Rotaria sp. Silwood2]
MGARGKRSSRPIPYRRTFVQKLHELTILYFFEIGERLNGEIHSNLQQDVATTDTSEKSDDWFEKYLKSFIPKDRWSSNSPELNSLDYCILDCINKNINYQKCYVEDDLEREIMQFGKQN